MFDRVKAVGLACVLLTSFWASTSHANHHAEAHDVRICAPNLVALGGYDPVSYHDDGGPVMGTESVTTKVGELSYWFESEQNLDAFVANPEGYTPTYLGWCSTNLAMGRLACPDFKNFKIENGRLLLFEHAGFTNGRDVWNSDPTDHRRRADENFARFSN